MLIMVWSWDPVLRCQQKVLCKVLELFRLFNIFLWLIHIWTSLLFILFAFIAVPVCTVPHRISKPTRSSVGTKSENFMLLTFTVQLGLRIRIRPFPIRMHAKKICEPFLDLCYIHSTFLDC
jgi:hypothetical protein